MIPTAHLFPGLHRHLMELLQGLDEEDWTRPTVAGAWRVRDVAAHLLDGQLRRLSFQRDGHPPPEPEGDVSEHEALVTYLDGLNALWVEALDRASPRVITDLLGVVGPQLADFVATLDPEAPAFFPVAWAGEDASACWMDVGRDYTELWHHQAQIRDAVGVPPLDGARWLGPVLGLGFLALRRGLAGVERPPGTALVVRVTGEAGGAWTAEASADGWAVREGEAASPAARAVMDPDTAWRLLFNALPRGEAAERLRREGAFTGDEALRDTLLATRSVMV